MVPFTLYLEAIFFISLRLFLEDKYIQFITYSIINSIYTPNLYNFDLLFRQPIPFNILENTKLNPCLSAYLLYIKEVHTNVLKLLSK